MANAPGTFGVFVPVLIVLVVIVAGSALASGSRFRR